MCSRRRRHSAGIDLSCVQTRWQFRTRVSHYGDSAQNIPSSGSGEPSAAHFPESSPPSPCGLRLDSLRSLRWEFMARACPAGAREAGFFRCPHNSENHKSAAKAGGPAGLESAISHERPILTIQAVRGRKGTRPRSPGKRGAQSSLVARVQTYMASYTIWRTRHDSNVWPSPSEGDALSS